MSPDFNRDTLFMIAVGVLSCVAWGWLITWGLGRFFRWSQRFRAAEVRAKRRALADHNYGATDQSGGAGPDQVRAMTSITTVRLSLGRGERVVAEQDGSARRVITFYGCRQLHGVIAWKPLFGIFRVHVAEREPENPRQRNWIHTAGDAVYLWVSPTLFQQLWDIAGTEGSEVTVTTHPDPRTDVDEMMISTVSVKVPHLPPVLFEIEHWWQAVSRSLMKTVWVGVAVVAIGWAFHWLGRLL